MKAWLGVAALAAVVVAALWWPDAYGPGGASPTADAPAPMEAAQPASPTAADVDLAALRARLVERIPALAELDEISPTPMPGLYEVRIGADVIYVDAQGDYLLQGQLIDTRERRNLTQERVDKLSAIDFASLPLEDAIVMVNGDGARKMVVFSDPNCGFCKRFERDLLKVDNVTVYTFLYPILSPDSHEKARNVWCAQDRLATWQAWMLDGQVPPQLPQCDTPVDRLVALGRQFRVTGTPTTVFENGTRVPGAMPATQLEQQLQANTPAR